MENQLPTTGFPSSSPSCPPSKHRLWLAVATLIFSGLAAVFFAARDSQDQIERSVEAILQEARKNERIVPSVFERLVYFLPGPLSDWGDRLLSRKSKGDHGYVDALVKLGTNAAPILVRVVKTDGSPVARRISAMALGELKASFAVPVLTNALIRDTNTEVRSSVVSALMTMEEKSALPVLKSTLRNDVEDSVRTECASALAALGGRDAIPDLLAASRTEKSWMVRGRLASAFGQFRCAESLPQLTAWLREQQPTSVAGNSPGLVMGTPRFQFEVTDIIHALGRVGGETAYQVLTERWKVENDTNVRQTLARALGELGDSRALPLLQDALHQDARLDSAIAEALGDLGNANASEALIALLDDAEAHVRRNAAAALGQLGSLQAVPHLKQLLESENDQWVRGRVCKALGMIGDPTASETIMKALSQLGDSREDAVWALGHLRSTNSIATLAQELNANGDRVRFAAAYALVQIGGPAAADALASNLSDKEEFARHGKACALTMLGRTNGLELVRKGLRAKLDWQRFSAALALARYPGAVETGELTPMLADATPTLRRFAIETAAGRTVPALVEMLRDTNDDYRQYAARAVMFFDDPSALPALREACGDRDASVRDAARLAVRYLERTTQGPNRKS